MAWLAAKACLNRACTADARSSCAFRGGRCACQAEERHGNTRRLFAIGIIIMTRMMLLMILSVMRGDKYDDDADTALGILSPNNKIPGHLRRYYNSRIEFFYELSSDNQHIVMSGTGTVQISVQSKLNRQKHSLSVAFMQDSSNMLHGGMAFLESREKTA